MELAKPCRGLSQPLTLVFRPPCISNRLPGRLPFPPEEGAERALARSVTDGADARRMPYRPALDGVRGVAILIVMLDHAGFGTFANSGNVGVTLFFVLSGFLITSLLLDEWTIHGRIDLPAFLMRRALRLLPALVVLLVGVSVLMVLAGRAGEAGGDVLPTLLYFMNWAKVAGEDPGYLSHAWSLSIEEQFYLAWPPLLIALLILGRDRFVPIGTFIIAAAIAVAAWRAALWAPDAVDRVLWATDTRADALLLGCAAAIITRSRRWRMPQAAGWAAGVALAGVLLLSELASFAITGLAVVAASSVVLVLAATQDGSVARTLCWRPLVFVGSISYGLYLFHRPVMRVASGIGLEGQVVPMLLAATFSVLLAWVSWRYVEHPALRFKRRWVASRQGASEPSTAAAFEPVSVAIER